MQLLVDQMPRFGPWRVTFDTNPDDCNLHCIMCEEHSQFSSRQRQRIEQGRPRRRMTFDLIRQVVQECNGAGLREIIPSTMGEPLLYTDMSRVIGLCADYGLRLNLTTNGTFPGKGAAVWARLIVPVSSDVKISWNGARKKTHESIMVGASWQSSLRNLQTFVAVRDEHAAAGGNRCRVTLQVTFTEMNVKELPEVVKLAVDCGVDRVKGHHLWTHFPEIEDLSMRRSGEAIRRWNQAVEAAYQVAERHRLPSGKRVLLENIFPLEPGAKTDIAPSAPCPFLGKEAWISAEGRFDPCCAPDDLRRGLGDFGNIREQSLLEIWHGTDYQHLLRTYGDRPLCRACNMRAPEKTKCFNGRTL